MGNIDPTSTSFLKMALTWLFLILIMKGTIIQADTEPDLQPSVTSYDSSQDIWQILRKVIKSSMGKVHNANQAESDGEDTQGTTNDMAGLFGNHLVQLLGKFTTQSSNKDEKQNELPQLLALTNILKSVADGLTTEEGKNEVGSIFLQSVLENIPEGEGVQDFVSDYLGLHRKFGKTLFKIINAIKDVNSNSKFKSVSKDKSSIKSKLSKYSQDKLDTLSNEITEGSEEPNNVANSVAFEDANKRFMKLIKEIFTEEFGTVDLAALTSVDGSGEPGFYDYNISNMTGSGIWMMVKSTWQRILAYVDKENALKRFMTLTPVKIIDRLLNIGDDVNLVNFLAKKLDPEFATFLVSSVNPYLGPLRDFDSFYNFTREYGLNEIVDHFSSERVSATLSTMSRLISAYMQDSVSDNLINEYIDFISFNNTDLSHLYKSFLASQIENSTNEGEGYNRYKRETFSDIVKAFEYQDGYGIHTLPQLNNNETNDALSSSRDLSSQMDVSSGRDLSRSSGYGGSGGYGGGGGGYGGGGGGYGMMTTMLDPYVALGALALGTLLGFLLFRLIFGTRRRGRRDINDGSLSLWLSDIPDVFFPRTQNVERMKRSFNQTEDDISVPNTLRGDVWSSDPLVGENFFEDLFEEDDIADELNHIWRIYKNSSSPACIHSHMCHVLANSTAEDLTGKDSNMALLMASVSNLMGVVRSGQLVDHVTQTLVLGNPYSCPSSLPTCQYLF